MGTDDERWLTRMLLALTLMAFATLIAAALFYDVNIAFPLG